jgi:hypothetical protein
MLPLPFYLVETGYAPLLRIALLAGITLAVIVAEGTSGAVGIASAIVLAQVATYAAVTWLASGWMVKLLGRGSRRTMTAVTMGILIAGLIVTSSVDLYRTPFRRDAPRSSLIDLLR